MLGLLGRIILLPGSLAGLMLAWPAAAASEAAAAGEQRRPVELVMGTATPGGGFPAYGDALVTTISKTDPALAIKARHTRGSGENIPLLEAGKIDIGLVQGEAAHEALHGSPPSKVKMLAAMYPTPGMFVVRADSPYKHIKDLLGRPVAFGARSSGLVLLARYVLGGIGMELERDFQAVFLDNAGDGPALVKDGTVAAFWGGGTNWPGFVEVGNAPEGARFIAPDMNEIEAIRSRHPFLKMMTVPADSYRNQPEPLTSVGSWSFIMARPDLPDDTAYRFVKALHRGEAGIAKLLPQARETTAANTAAAIGHNAFLHPGALRYLKEIGLK